MTKRGPRIYVYKITFLEVPHYYYGVHKEKVFNEEYWGSPVTHKNYWEIYTPQKEIIKEFSFTDDGYIEAQKYENSLIKPVYNADPLCLNEHCGGVISLDSLRKSGNKVYQLGLGVHALTFEQRSEIGKINGQKSYDLGVGIHGRSKEKMTEDGKKAGKIGGQKSYELGLGVHSWSKEQFSENGKKSGKIGGQRTYELGVGIYARTEEKIIDDAKKAYEAGLINLTREELSENGKIGGRKAHELGVGVHALTKEERIEAGKKGGQKAYELGVGVHARSKEQIIKDASNAGKKGGKVSSSQRWQCTVTGYVSNSGGLSRYQKARGIDTSNRIRIK